MPLWKNNKTTVWPKRFTIYRYAPTNILYALCYKIWNLKYSRCVQSLNKCANNLLKWKCFDRVVDAKDRAIAVGFASLALKALGKFEYKNFISAIIFSPVKSGMEGIIPCDHSRGTWSMTLIKTQNAFKYSLCWNFIKCWPPPILQYTCESWSRHHGQISVSSDHRNSYRDKWHFYL